MIQSMGKFISIAIDGPAAAGKSSLAKNIAEKLGFVYLKTGWLYRAVGLFVSGKNIAGNDVYAIEECISRAEAGIEELKPELVYCGNGGVQKIYLNGRDISDLVNNEKIGKYASDVGNIRKVRDFLLAPQREAAQKYNVVVEGRDIGTVILPKADVKIFLTATAEARAERRAADENRYYEQVLREINERDRQDSGRAVAPLRPAEDAVILDNSGLAEAQTLRIALDIIRERIPHVDIR